ncbi:MAG: hypothetical protein ACU843_15435, partial [Gammaproteobacteria bacterium]
MSVDALALWVVLLPFFAAAILGLGLLSGRLDGEPHERLSAGIALWSVAISAGLSLVMLGSSLSGLNRGDLNLGTWLDSGSFTVAIGFSTQGLG